MRISWMNSIAGECGAKMVGEGLREGNLPVGLSHERRVMQGKDDVMQV
jgi:hypothetical protein